MTKKYLSEIKDLMQEWDWEANADLDPTKLTIGSSQKIWWKCKVCGHSWKASVNDRVSKSSGCPNCAKHIRTSFPEQAIFYYIKKLYPNSISQYKPKFLNKMEIDIFIPELKTGIEYDGAHWHNIEGLAHEEKKYNFCKNAGIKLIRIIEKDLAFLSHTADCKILLPNTDCTKLKKLEIAIRTLIFILDNSHTFADIDLKRDEIHIRKMYKGYPKNSLSTSAPEIAKEWDYTKNGKLIPLNVSQFAQCKVYWICSKCGKSFESTIANRTFNKSGCPYCSHRRVLTGINDLATQYPELAKQWHPTKNENLIPSEVFSHSNKKVWWLCSKGHSFLQNVHNRTEGQKCPYCSGRKLLPGFNDLATKNPQLASEWHPTKNKNLTPSDVMPGSNKKVWWLCKKCGYEWQAIINNRSGKKSRCPECSKKKNKNQFEFDFK